MQRSNGEYGPRFRLGTVRRRITWEDYAPT
jgi:hypothetical protein